MKKPFFGSQMFLLERRSAAARLCDRIALIVGVRHHRRFAQPVATVMIVIRFIIGGIRISLLAGAVVTHRPVRIRAHRCQVLIVIVATDAVR